MKTSKSRTAGFTLPELLIFLAGLLIPAFFLIYFSPGITAQVYQYQAKKNLREIHSGLYVYAAQDSELAFPKSDSARDAFLKIFTEGNIIDPLVFDDPRLPNGKPSGTPGPLFLSPSKDLIGVDFLYSKEPLTMNSPPDKVIVTTQPLPEPLKTSILALHLDGQITEEKTLPSGDFA